ncbi:MAG: dTDP-4-dehydrorhamnose 3,5-epimerase family protein [Candidatus Omnitrophota bacterium]
MIKDVYVKTLKVIPDERGRLMEILRSDEKIFRKFGQVYMTSAYPEVVKAWHYHKKQDDCFTCVCGMIKLVLYDRRENSSTHQEINEFFLGQNHPILVRIPPHVCHGFKAIGTEEAVVINIVSECYNYKKPDEFRIPPHTHEIPYDWSRKDG